MVVKRAGHVSNLIFTASFSWQSLSEPVVCYRPLHPKEEVNAGFQQNFGQTQSGNPEMLQMDVSAGRLLSTQGAVA